GRHRILLINWSDETQAMSFDCAAHGVSCSSVTDFWHDNKLPVNGGNLTVSLQPRSCLLVETQA
ncbi:MAG: hypothetical protein J6X55_06875, partial [Victivallales bacterium]|nr:hypothetical protein [Victivallales bacterium]